jgi:hypothetical protein
MEKLKALLKSLSQEKISEKEIQELFEKIAVELINNSRVEVGINMFQIKEIEFYLHRPEHNDPYVDRSDAQKTFGLWYLNRFTSHDAYDERNRYKRIDITFGENGNHGGILIRSIKPLNETHTSSVIVGPSKVADKIRAYVKEAGSSLDNIKNDQEGYVFSSESPMRIVAANNFGRKILSYSRHGLSDKKEDGAEYHSRHYRFFDDECLAKIKGKETIFRNLVKRSIYQIGDAVTILGYNIKQQ